MNKLLSVISYLVILRWASDDAKKRSLLEAANMKTVPSPFFIDTELRKAIENVLELGESVTSFVEQAIRDTIKRKQLQQVFVSRSLASCESALKNGEYYSAEDILNELDELLER